VTGSGWAVGRAPGAPGTRSTTVQDHPPARVVARGLGVRHASRMAWALSGVDLIVEPGERVLLTGPSGAGKSTLLSALAGLLDPEGTELAGTLTVGGRASRDARDSVGLLAQDPDSQLVMTRAGDDVAFGLENAGLPPEAIWPEVDDALAAVAFRYGRERPTQALSGGEKQRLVLAGALVRRPGLLLLDEPTAQLDVRGEAEIFERVLAQTRHCTTILVSHRFSTVRKADRICVLEDGRVVELGTHDELIALAGRYRTMFDLQAARFAAGLPEDTEEGTTYDVLA
jgi:energy-coupling factor transporter ATP-binding protein EcfA2